ncbi:E3 binding domain-containing protein [Deinococcus apachensis]|uniref:E3 binding domain-containing protein n=1 Tax=Deinococcus apachensis TaxID=309886 RepID=UPI000373D498|nr:E3 binding domain-containing protein [Deinococcus apachensis]
MERIAPLAKILAEANGIDWRNLHGSGEGGLIVEQDILNYLSRIMSGEEEPPSTPVDAPPPEWNGTELPPGGGLLAPGMPSMDMLSSAGVDQDLAALVAQPQPTAPAPATLEEEALEFELEEDEQLPPVPQPERRPAEVPAFAAPAFPAAEVAPLAAPAPEFVPPAPVLGRERPAAPAGHTPGLAAVAQPEPVAARAEPTPPPAAPAGGLRGGLGGLLSRLYQQPAAQPEPTPAAPPAPPTPAPLLPEIPAAAARPIPTPQLPEVEAPVAAVPVVEAPVVEVPAPAPELQPGVRDVAEVEPDEAVALAPEVPAVPAMEEQPEAQAAEPEAALPEPAAPAVQPVPEAARPREAVWFGAYLRRDANLAPAAELRRQLTAALGQDVPLALLVARAAARHAEGLDLGTVAVQDTDVNQARPVQSGSLRDALAALRGEHSGTPDLLVIDAGALDLDDLHLGHTVTLSVGRVQDGRAALTLNGDVDAVRAARFLASVAATLEEPIILVI